MGGDFNAVRIVFFGTPDVAVPALKHLVDAGYDIPLVVTQPDRPSGRSGRPVASPVKRFALDAGLTVEQPLKVRTRVFRDRVGACKPDLLAVVAFGRILSLRLIEQTPLGAVNLHFSLLPRYRGAAPVQWALAHGERSTGVTTICINDRLDEGEGQSAFCLVDGERGAMRGGIRVDGAPERGHPPPEGSAMQRGQREVERDVREVGSILARKR